LTATGLMAGFDSRVADAAMMETFVQEATKFPRFPNGASMDPLPVIDPRRISPPTMVIMGSLDRNTPITQPDLPAFYRDLSSPDKQFIVVPDAGHGLFLHKARLRFYIEVTKWFNFDQPGWGMEVTRGVKPQ